ncbi:MAG: D-alanyl-D-alanine carboxypeptidase family protein [Fusobacteriota bacterium]
MKKNTQKRFKGINKFKLQIGIIIFLMMFSVSQAADEYKAIALSDQQGNLLEGENVDLVHPLAALTKLMTGLVAIKQIEEGKFSYDDKITISRSTASVRGSSVRLRTGQKVTLEELIEGAVVKSGNDAAYGVAEYISGSEEEFVKLMNKEAKKMGLENTEFFTSTGLPTNMTEKNMDIGTASDMVKLAAESLKYPKIIEMASKESVKIGNRNYPNTNTLVKTMDVVDGLKTGYHSKAKYNLILTSKKDGVRLITVILGAESERVRNTVGSDFVKKGHADYNTYNVAEAGEFVLKTSIKKTVPKEIDLFLKEDIDVVIKNGEDWKLEKIAYVYKDIQGPIEAGEKLGELQIKYRGNVIKRVNLVSQKDLKKISFFRKLIRIITIGLL